MKRGNNAFTLVELLVSMAVLTLLIVMVAQMVSYTSSVATTGEDQMSADADARLVLDRIAWDFSNMILSKDIDYLFVKDSGNDRLAFYSEVSGFYPGSVSSTHRHTASIVGYQINADYQLERISKGLTWGHNPAVPVRPLRYLPVTLEGGYADLWTADKQVLSSGVFRLEVTFLLKDGSISPTPYYPSNSAPDGMKDVSAVIVAIGVLPERARVIAPVTAATAAALVDAATAPPLAAWQPVMDSNFAQTSGLPQAAASAARIYQRFFYLP